MTTISRTTPSIGDVTGNGRTGVISAGASALSRTEISPASATTAAVMARVRQVARLLSQRLTPWRSLRQARYGAEKRTMLSRVNTSSAPSLATSMSTGLPGTAPNE